MKYYVTNSMNLERDIINIDNLLLDNITSEESLTIVGNDEKYLKILSDMYWCEFAVEPVSESL